VRLESKLSIGTGVLVLAMFLSALTAHLLLLDVMHRAAQIDSQRRPFILALRSAEARLDDTVVALESSMLLGPPSSRHAVIYNSGQDAERTLDDDLALLRERGSRLDLGLDKPRLESMLAQVRTLDLLERQAEDLRAMATPETGAQARTLIEDRILPLNTAIHQAVSDIVQHQTAIAEAEVGQLLRADSVILIVLWTATVAGAVVGFAVSHSFTRRITRSIDLVAARADAIAAGDLTGEPLNITSKDQVGELAYAMQQMQASLAGIIGTVAHTAASLTESAASMRSATDHVHTQVEEQTQQTQQAATAMQEMSASIAEVSRHTQSAAETARAASQTAQEGGEIVQQVLSSMRSIAAAVSETSSTIGLLGEDSHRISQIVTVIEEIAHRTNLLALNAAIEAARAGEQGRGFAVVAGEVRHLAESTAKATGEIAAMIQGIQARTRTAVASMASGTETVEQGVATTNRAGQALERIIGMAERVDRMTAQIAIAASQQAAAADQSSSSLDSIHTLSHENLSEIAIATAGIEGLRATAVTLERQVESFRLAPAAPTVSGTGSTRVRPDRSQPQTLALTGVA
jgi:methyl-accepting chemotaxis protein